MPELQRIDLSAVRKLVSGNYGNGLEYFKKGAVSGTWRSAETLHAQVSGSAAQPYIVSAGSGDDSSFWAKCNCPAARRQPICKHAAALLVAWAERPDSFSFHEEPEKTASGAPKLESEAKRVRAPKTERQDLIKAGLEKAESLLVDLASQGLTSATREQVATIGSLAEALEAHKLRRLARQVAEIGRAAERMWAREERFDERAWTRLLSDSWFTLVATKKALAEGNGANRSELEELVGKTWLEKDLERVEGLRMAELAYETSLTSDGFRVETSFLLELERGELYTEKQITPVRLKNVDRKRSYACPLHVSVAGVYPGFQPNRIKLIEVTEEPADCWTWAGVIDHAETSAVALRQRLIQATSTLVAPQEIYSLFRPAEVLVSRGTLFMMDNEGKALVAGGGSQASKWALEEVLSRSTVGAVFGRVRFGETALEMEPLSAVPQEGSSRLVRLAG